MKDKSLNEIEEQIVIELQKLQNVVSQVEEAKKASIRLLEEMAERDRATVATKEEFDKLLDKTNFRIDKITKELDNFSRTINYLEISICNKLQPQKLKDDVEAIRNSMTTQTIFNYISALVLIIALLLAIIK